MTRSPVLFDPELDVALLWPPTSTPRPLSFAATDPKRGALGATLGYPGGGPLTISPAAVAARYEATGRDIYDVDHVQREILELRAQVDRVDSGGPLVLSDWDGRRRGLRGGPDQPDVGYALAPEAVWTRIRPGIGRRSTIDTGPCIH
jgi:hypothetical protein